MAQTVSQLRKRLLDRQKWLDQIDVSQGKSFVLSDFVREVGAMNADMRELFQCLSDGQQDDAPMSTAK